MAATGDVTGQGRPVLRFLGGLTSGLVLFGAALIALTVASDVYEAREKPQRAGLEIAFTGAEADRHGARQAVVTTSEGVVHERCRGACDDLKIDGAKASSLRLLDAQGRSVAYARREFFGWTGDRASLAVSRRTP